MKLNHKLGFGANHKDYLTIIKTDRITYIHKDTRTKITLRRRDYGTKIEKKE